MTGTILDTVLATIAASLVRPGPLTLSILGLVFVWCSYALLWVNYAIFVVPLTAYVVTLLASAGLPSRLSSITVCSTHCLEASSRSPCTFSSSAGSGRASPGSSLRRNPRHGKLP
jgi:hypothetical protein